MSAIVLRLLEEYLRREGQHQLVPPEIRQIEDGVIRTILELGRRTQDVAESIAILRKELIQATACVHSWIGWVDERYPDLSQDDQHSTIEVKVGLTDVDGDDEPQNES